MTQPYTPRTYTPAEAATIHEYERQCPRLVGPSWDTPLTADEIAEIERPLTTEEHDKAASDIEDERRR